MRISGRMALAPAFAGLLFLALAPAAQAASLVARLDDAVLEELNFARAQPAEYADELKQVSAAFPIQIFRSEPIERRVLEVVEIAPVIQRTCP